MNNEALKQALGAAYLAGFNASGQGWNAEHPFQDYNKHPEKDAGWVQKRDAYIREALAEQPAPMIRGDIRDGLVDDEPAQRTWVGLTDDEILYCVELENPKAIAEEVEAKLKEKNT